METESAQIGAQQTLPAPLVQLAQEMADISLLEQTAIERLQLVQAQVTETFGPGARALGMEGQIALLEGWNGQQNTQDYFDSFAAYYRAGLAMGGMNWVPVRYIWALTEQQKQAAYHAGEQDAVELLANGGIDAGRGRTLGRELTPTPTAGTMDSSMSQDRADTDNGAGQDLTDTESGTDQDTIKLHDGEQPEPSARLGQSVTESGPQKPGTVKQTGTVDFSDKHAVFQQLMQAQTDFAALDYEMNCTITSDGKVWRVCGTSGQVSPWGIEALGSSLRGSYSYHNHPPKQTWYSFSAADVRFFFAAGEECAVAADDEYVYVMRRTEDTLDIDPDFVYHDFRKLRIKVWEHADQGIINIDFDEYHDTLRMLSEKYKFQYERWRRSNG